MAKLVSSSTDIRPLKLNSGPCATEFVGIGAKDDRLCIAPVRVQPTDETATAVVVSDGPAGVV